MTVRWVTQALRARAESDPAERLERRVGLGIAVLVPIFAVIGAFAMFSSEGPTTTPRRLLCLFVLATTIPVGAWWWRHGQRVVRMPGWFVFYADVGVAAVLLTFEERGLALHATVLFAVIGIYIAYFSRRTVLRLHSAFVSVFIVFVAVTTYMEGDHDVSSVAAQALASLVVVNSVIAFRTVIKTQLEQANTDSLTGLLNRRGFEHRIERLLTESNPDSHVAVFVVDLDRFKAVNDTYGHAAGDDVLKTTAERLGRAVPPGSCVARTGGEEFTIATPVARDDAPVVADRISAALQGGGDAPGAVSAGEAIIVTGSVGASILDVNAWKELSSDDAAAMVHSAMLTADNAMYDAKRSGGNQARIFDP